MSLGITQTENRHVYTEYKYLKLSLYLPKMYGNVQPSGGKRTCSINLIEKVIYETV